MLIFGYGPRTPKDLGPVAPAQCARCRNTATFHHLQRRNWFSLFFVPVVPVSTTHALVCPVCGYEFVIPKGRISRVDEMVDLTAAQLAGRLHPTDYQGQVNAFWTEITGSHIRSAAPEPETDAWPGGPGASPPRADQQQPNPPAGWYPDPFGHADQRYWDGERWTAGTNPPVFDS